MFFYYLGACNLPAEFRQPTTFFYGYTANNNQIILSFDKTTMESTDGSK